MNLQQISFVRVSALALLALSTTAIATTSTSTSTPATPKTAPVVSTATATTTIKSPTTTNKKTTFTAAVATLPATAPTPATRFPATAAVTSTIPGQAPNPIAGATVGTYATQTEKVSYTIGLDLGKNFKRQGIDINQDALIQGLKDALNDANPRMSAQDMMQTLQDFQKVLLSKRLAQFNQTAQQNLDAGKKFLATNKVRPDVVTLPSGLQYRVITNGVGVRPTLTDVVTVDYTGRLLNGKVFDSSKKMGHPAKFRVNSVIKGWTEALQLMPVGSTWEIFVPSELAYGARGIGGPIGPNETLIFSIQLSGVSKTE